MYVLICHISYTILWRKIKHTWIEWNAKRCDAAEFAPASNKHSKCVIICFKYCMQKTRTAHTDWLEKGKPDPKIHLSSLMSSRLSGVGFCRQCVFTHSIKSLHKCYAIGFVRFISIRQTFNAHKCNKFELMMMNKWLDYCSLLTIHADI